eukprot:Hpha_TRINITY_DN15487_c3_g5::TRINITY_DN15487_c3_g5_i1::g.177370::m.177370
MLVTPRAQPRLAFEPPVPISAFLPAVVRIAVIRRPLRLLPGAVGPLSHSALLLTCEDDSRELVEYMDDGRVHRRQVRVESPGVVADGGRRWRVAGEGWEVGGAWVKVTALDVEFEMRRATAGRNYEMFDWNCHRAQREAREAVLRRVWGDFEISSTSSVSSSSSSDSD